MPLILLLCTAWAGPQEDFLMWVQRMNKTANGLTDVTFTFYKIERVGGSVVREDGVAVKFRKPFDLYMTWSQGDAKGRELLYKQGWNDGKFRIALGGWKPTLDLDPRGRLARRKNRHTIFNLDFAYVTGRLATDTARVQEKGLAAVVTDLGEQTVRGDAAQCYQIDLPRDQDPEAYADRVEACVNLRTWLPARNKAWMLENGEYVLVESYERGDIQVDVGLADSDFDPANPAYGF